MKERPSFCDSMVHERKNSQRKMKENEVQEDICRFLAEEGLESLKGSSLKCVGEFDNRDIEDGRESIG